MATRGKPVPLKLKHDAIIEALLEIRFETTTIPEVLFGKLADYEPWRGFKQNPMPAYALPAPIRQADPNLRFQPIFELLGSDDRLAVRIGPQVLSYHRMPPYVGWGKFETELSQAIEGLFTRADSLTVRRLGFRYVNALRPDLHGIRSTSDLDLKVEIDGEKLSGNVNINFIINVSDNTRCTVRIATPEFVQGVLPPNTAVVADVDVFTTEGFNTKEVTDVKRWLDFAHSTEKHHFFRLLTNETIEALKEN
jgi:uncharacterized protein (TIGR04255 family)